MFSCSYIYLSFLRQGSAPGQLEGRPVQKKGSISVNFPVAYSADVLRTWAH